jgi:Arm DNA-binding domain
MPHASLTEAYFHREARDLPTGVAIDYFSIDTKKLSLRVRGPSEQYRKGLLSWRFVYRFDGKQIPLTFGHYPTWPSAEAHAKARRLQVILDEKRDPRAVLFPQPEPLPAPVVQPSADTVRAMFARYEVELDNKSNNYRRNVTGFFNNYILPAWSERDIHSLTKREIVDLRKVVKTKSGPVAANRFGTATSAWFTFLVREGVLEVSLASKLPRTEERPREQVLTEPQLVRVWRAAD